MANRKITIPPNNGTLSAMAGDTITITASADCTFSCTVGDSFSPSLTSVHVAIGDNGPYIAQRTASGTYSVALAAAFKANIAKSVQITP